MPPSKNINTYADVQAVLDQIKAYGSGTYRLATEGKARNWMQRAYSFRKIFQEQARIRANIKGFTPPTDYDMIRMELQGPAVFITFAPEPVGEISLPNGQVLKPETSTQVKQPPAPAPIPPVVHRAQSAAPKPGVSLDLTHLSSLAEELGKIHGDD